MTKIDQWKIFFLGFRTKSSKSLAGQSFSRSQKKYEKIMGCHYMAGRVWYSRLKEGKMIEADYAVTDSRTTCCYPST